MAIIKVAKGSKSLNALLNYIANKTELVSGKDCSDELAIAKQEMLITKQVYAKTDGRQYKHYIQSFAPNEVTPQRANNIAKQWAEKSFPGYEVYIATNTDKGHVHNHFVVNSVSFETGYKLQSSKQSLERLKQESDLICQREGLSIVDRSKKQLEQGKVTTYDMAKYQLLKRIQQGEKVKSYLLETAVRIKQALRKATSKDEFIDNMKQDNYQVFWQDNRKHITYVHPEGHKVRASNLEKTFNDKAFTKEGMLNEFEFRRKSLSRGDDNQEQRTTTERTRTGNLQSTASLTKQYRYTRNTSDYQSKIRRSTYDDTKSVTGDFQRKLCDLKERAKQCSTKDQPRGKQPKWQDRNNSRSQQDFSR